MRSWISAKIRREVFNWHRFGAVATISVNLSVNWGWWGSTGRIQTGQTVGGNRNARWADGEVRPWPARTEALPFRRIRACLTCIEASYGWTGKHVGQKTHCGQGGTRRERRVLGFGFIRRPPEHSCAKHSSTTAGDGIARLLTGSWNDDGLNSPSVNKDVPLSSNAKGGLPSGRHGDTLWEPWGHDANHRRITKGRTCPQHRVDAWDDMQMPKEDRMRSLLSSFSSFGLEFSRKWFLWTSAADFPRVPGQFFLLVSGLLLCVHGIDRHYAESSPLSSILSSPTLPSPPETPIARNLYTIETSSLQDGDHYAAFTRLIVFYPAASHKAEKSPGRSTEYHSKNAFIILVSEETLQMSLEHYTKMASDPFLRDYTALLSFLCDEEVFTSSSSVMFVKATENHKVETVSAGYLPGRVSFAPTSIKPPKPDRHQFAKLLRHSISNT
ncbi:uncharacterized protein BDR25DRAFT_359132 [Lindgomyces ingoldianus]|uniref:Uncharacterized protein n=1 Tax=Lindgomyces ingoldianus TaxID=673940 RepID=A0ACB6QJQ8_9PLEO|nr:uncharacterized protein BDR25DRAFT_359132 [Lindgomyces ingoldianus]KAF2467102.1 hypothetical protein BDR25DRAFT_359132 [Lindgomyces ingoldianus]